MRKKIVRIKSTAAGILAGIIAGTILMLTGCGQGSGTGTDPAAEEQESEGEQSAETEQATEEEKTAEEQTSEAEESTEADTTDDEGVNVEQLDENGDVVSGSSKNYLKYMSEDELKELAVEALAAAGKDTSLADGTLKTKGVTFDLPEGFEESEDTSDFYITDRYPIDASNVIYEELEADYTMQLMDQDYFSELLKEAVLEETGEDTEVNILEFKAITIDGVPAFRIMDEYTLDGNDMTQLVYVINGSKTYCIIYTETSDYDRIELFEASAQTISVEK